MVTKCACDHKVCLLIVYDNFELSVEGLMDDGVYLGHHLNDIGVLEDKVSFGIRSVSSLVLCACVCVLH